MTETITAPPPPMHPSLNLALGTVVKEAGELLAALGDVQCWGWGKKSWASMSPARHTHICICGLRSALDELEYQLALQPKE